MKSKSHHSIKNEITFPKYCIHGDILKHSVFLNCCCILKNLYHNISLNKNFMFYIQHTLNPDYNISMIYCEIVNKDQDLMNRLI